MLNFICSNSNKHIPKLFKQIKLNETHNTTIVNNYYWNKTRKKIFCWTQHSYTGKFCISFYNLWDSTLVKGHSHYSHMKNIYIKQHNTSNLYLSASNGLNFKLGKVLIQVHPALIGSHRHLLGAIFFISIDPLTFINPFTISAQKIPKFKEEKGKGRRDWVREMFRYTYMSIGSVKAAERKRKKGNIRLDCLFLLQTMDNLLFHTTSYNFHHKVYKPWHVDGVR